MTPRASPWFDVASRRSRTYAPAAGSEYLKANVRGFVADPMMRIQQARGRANAPIERARA